MGVRVGASWRTGPGRRAWVSVPGWLLLPYLAVLPVILAVIVAWYLAVGIVKAAVIIGQGVIAAIRRRAARNAVGS